MIRFGLPDDEFDQLLEKVLREIEEEETKHPDRAISPMRRRNRNTLANKLNTHSMQSRIEKSLRSGQKLKPESKENHFARRFADSQLKGLQLGMSLPLIQDPTGAQKQAPKRMLSEVVHEYLAWEGPKRVQTQLKAPR